MRKLLLRLVIGFVNYEVETLEARQSKWFTDRGYRRGSIYKFALLGVIVVTWIIYFALHRILFVSDVVALPLVEWLVGGLAVTLTLACLVAGSWMLFREVFLVFAPNWNDANGVNVLQQVLAKRRDQLGRLHNQLAALEHPSDDNRGDLRHD